MLRQNTLVPIQVIAMRPLLIAALSLLISPAARAETVAEQFASAYATFGGLLDDVDFSAAAIEALIPTLTGHWVRIDILAGGGITAPVEEFDMAMFCSRVVEDLVPDGPHGFRLTRLNLAQPENAVLETRYAYLGMQSFQRQVDETQMLAYFRFDADTPPPFGFYLSNGQNGRVRLYHPSPDLLVFVDERGLSEYRARCPG